MLHYVCLIDNKWQFVVHFRLYVVSFLQYTSSRPLQLDGIFQGLHVMSMSWTKSIFHQIRALGKFKRFAKHCETLLQKCSVFRAQMKGPDGAMTSQKHLDYWQNGSLGVEKEPSHDLCWSAVASGTSENQSVSGLFIKTSSRGLQAAPPSSW